MGVMWATLNLEGYTLIANDLLNSSAKGLSMINAIILSNLTGIWSGPVDLFWSRVFNNVNTSCSVVYMRSRMGAGVVLVGLFGGWCESGMFSVD